MATISEGAERINVPSVGVVLGAAETEKS